MDITMAETVQDIVVRTLSGESTIVSLPADSTIEHLKILLRQNFPAATRYPNFHLYFKGVQLGLRSSISEQNISNGQFLVLVPFTKKPSNVIRQSDQSKSSVNTANANSISRFADQAWNEMMQDFSSLHDNAKTDNHSGQADSSNVNDREEKMAGNACPRFSEVKRRRGNNCGNGEKEEKKSCAGSNSSSHSGLKRCHVGRHCQYGKLVLFFVSLR
uniref:Ubiquitin-like domain-containing protein n=1 Tax=Cannabis sativa TaxID=3483 RepID=A0A803QYD5_CANSA